MEQNIEQIVAANLTELRKAHKWTQAELAEKINYSDKSVSKWERGEGLPDLKVLLQLAELFGVSLDCLVTENAVQEEYIKLPKQRVGFRVIVELLAVSIVFLIAAVVYMAYATYMKSYFWMAFIWAVPISMLLLTVFNAHWKFHVCVTVFGSVFAWTLLAAVYLQMLEYNLWTVFLIGIPAQAAIILGTLMRKKW